MRKISTPKTGTQGKPNTEAGDKKNDKKQQQQIKTLSRMQQAPSIMQQQSIFYGNTKIYTNLLWGTITKGKPKAESQEN